MKYVTRKQGDDIVLSITVGSNVSIDDLAELYVFIVRQSDDETVAQFSKAGSGDYDALDKISSTNYEAKWLSGDTKLAEVDDYRVEGNVVATDADFESSQENRITTRVIIHLEKANAKTASSG